MKQEEENKRKLMEKKIEPLNETIEENVNKLFSESENARSVIFYSA